MVGPPFLYVTLYRDKSGRGKEPEEEEKERNGRGGRASAKCAGGQGVQSETGHLKPGEETG